MNRLGLRADFPKLAAHRRAQGEISVETTASFSMDQIEARTDFPWRFEHKLYCRRPENKTSDEPALSFSMNRIKARTDFPGGFEHKPYCRRPKYTSNLLQASACTELKKEQTSQGGFNTGRTAAGRNRTLNLL